MSKGNFANNEGMDDYAAIIELRLHRRVLAPQMVDPDRAVCQDHLPKRRRGGAFNRGEVPPSRARRRALSRSIRALSASRTRADFSSIFVSSRAMESISSSRVRV